jgi:hypothetical protein
VSNQIIEDRFGRKVAFEYLSPETKRELREYGRMVKLAEFRLPRHDGLTDNDGEEQLIARANKAHETLAKFAEYV